MNYIFKIISYFGCLNNENRLIISLSSFDEMLMFVHNVTVVLMVRHYVGRFNMFVLGKVLKTVECIVRKISSLQYIW